MRGFSYGFINESGQEARIAGEPISANPFPWWHVSDWRDWRNGWKFQDSRINSVDGRGEV